jgi:hypothetical protein
MDDQGVVIRCFRVGNPEVLEVPGMTRANCVKCGYDVWISPSGMKIMEEKKARVVCDICLDPKLEKEWGPPILPPNNDQITDIQDGLWNRKNRN